MLTSFAAPTAVKLNHVFDDEVHEVCTSEDEYHFHEIHHNCDFKVKFHYPLLYEVPDEIILFAEGAHLQPLNLYSCFQGTTLLTSYLRGPPLLIA